MSRYASKQELVNTIRHTIEVDWNTTWPHSLAFYPDGISAATAKWLREQRIDADYPERVRAGRLLDDMVRVLPDGSIGEAGHRAADRVMHAAPYTLGR